MGGVLGMQVLRLALQVAALCGRRDSGVDDLFLLFLRGCGNDCLATTSHELTDIRLEVEEALSAEASNGSNPSCISGAGSERV